MQKLRLSVIRFMERMQGFQIPDNFFEISGITNMLSGSFDSNNLLLGENSLNIFSQRSLLISIVEMTELKRTKTKLFNKKYFLLRCC